MIKGAGSAFTEVVSAARRQEPTRAADRIASVLLLPIP